MMGHSHFLLAGAAYTAFLLHPVATPLGVMTAPHLSTGSPADGLALLVLGVVTAAVSGLAPDLDKTGSSIARSLGLVTRSAAWVTQYALGHRGPLHSFAGVLLIFVLGGLLGPLGGVYGLGGVLAFGWTMHVLTDATTRRGVPLWWPVSAHRVRLPPHLATGGLVEHMVLVVGLLACGGWAAAGVLPAFAMS